MLVLLLIISIIYFVGLFANFTLEFNKEYCYKRITFCGWHLMTFYIIKPEWREQFHKEMGDEVNDFTIKIYF